MVLIINPGSTSTKIALFSGDKEIFSSTLRHNAEELGQFGNITEQFSFRKEIIVSALDNAGYKLDDIKIIMARGGLIDPVQSGIYEVNSRMIRDLSNPSRKQHASNLGALIANDIALRIPGCKAYIADPVVVDELQDIARISGHPFFKRESIFHALNQKAIAKAYAEECGVPYEELRLIVVHMGGGISVGAHCNGKVIDVNQALSGDGPFSPERSGSLPANKLAEICFSGKYSCDEVSKIISGKGGYFAYLGTTDAGEVEKKAIAGEEEFLLIRNAMGYQIAKEIGAQAAVLEGRVDIIIFTGGIAYNASFVEYISNYVRFIADIKVYPGEDEMKALAINAERILNGSEKAKDY